MTRPVEISAREVRLVRECGQMYVDSHRIRGERLDRQPYEYREGLELLALAKKLAQYRRRHR